MEQERDINKRKNLIKKKMKEFKRLDRPSMSLKKTSTQNRRIQTIKRHLDDLQELYGLDADAAIDYQWAQQMLAAYALLLHSKRSLKSLRG